MKTIPLVIGCCLGATLVFAIEKGKTAFTKRADTALLEEPKPLAKSVATLPFAAGVRVAVVEGRWARVSSEAGKQTGWIYVGNLAEEKPVLDRGIDGLNTGPSATTTSAGARPLGKVGKAYAASKGFNAATSDIAWLEKLIDPIDTAAILEFLKTEKKGEFQ